MLSFVEKIAHLRSNWNKKPLTELDFHKLCRRRKITVVEMPLATNGFYYCVKGRHFIAVDSKLRQPKKLFVMFHEFAHYLMHAPDTGTTANFHGVGKKTRKEAEADTFAMCAIMPKPWIETRSVQEIVEDEGIPAEMLAERLALYSLRGI
jgi:Zn-dependent peptidase ImmA (M78 family)